MDNFDAYAVLGVERTASQADIRRAYRTLAQRHHPDLNQGSKEAEAKFKAVLAAWQAIGDEESRAAYDRELAAGQDRSAGGAVLWTAQTEITLADVANGVEKPVTLFSKSDASQRRRETLRLPAGLTDGIRLRFEFLRTPVSGRTLRAHPQGSVELTVRVNPRFKAFRLDEDGLHTVLKVTQAQARAGGRFRVETLGGEGIVTVPAGSAAGRVLRAQGRGLPNFENPDAPGNLLIHLEIDENPPVAGTDIFRRVCISTAEARGSCEITVTVPYEHGLRTVKLPVEGPSKEARTIRYPGLGNRGANGGANGTLVVLIHVTDDEKSLKESREGPRQSGTAGSTESERRSAAETTKRSVLSWVVTTAKGIVLMLLIAVVLIFVWWLFQGGTFSGLLG
ncbi:DnaJ C-terminal domain-containing protein [Sutterella sp.]|uniref:DnaJ C-terminal domain-containing protein n=1 Tax=Sutterella sp. TaxID=1981025 RepID=UPI0026DF7DC7|nr:DnaJ C-terminal domain-containing protein [Sutterella sp.]MDO5532258.1 DnaJ domain-containing protein [Sutterella sp.]